MPRAHGRRAGNTKVDEIEAGNLPTIKIDGVEVDDTDVLNFKTS